MTNTSYLSHLRQLRKIALKAIELYPIKLDKLKFIQHGENTTYKITTKAGGKYLLRIHRQDFHSEEGIKEELDWLIRLDKSHIEAPFPIKNNKNKYLTSVDNRNISILHWVEGKIISTGITVKHMRLVGELIADLHTHTKNYKTQYRKYWTADGLVGKYPLMGKTDKLSVLNTSDQSILNRAQTFIHCRLKKYESKYPEKMGFIHADLHYGNFCFESGVVRPIDFDDCGYGFHMYDLAVIFSSLNNRLRRKIITKEKYNELRAALIETYSLFHRLNEADIQIIKDLEIARRFMGTQWLNSRADDPRLIEDIAPYTKMTVQIIKKYLINEKLEH